MHTHELLTLSAAIVPDRAAIVFDGKRISFAELALRANRLANALADRGVGPGDRIAVIDVNGPAHLELYFAAARLDALYVPLNFRGRGEEIAFPLRHAKPRVLVAGERYHGLADSLRGQSAVEHHVTLGEPARGWLPFASLMAAGAEDELRFPEGDPSRTAVLLFTAGTTGQPKAVMLSHDSFTSYMLSSVEPADPEVEERTLLTLPMYHVAGLQSALASIYGGRTLVMQRQFEAREWMALIEAERIQRALVVPTMLKQVLDHPEFPGRDLSSLRVLTYGGASMPPSLIERAIRALPRVQFINAFGQTESGSTIAMVPPEDHVLEGPAEVVARRRKHLGSIGKPLADIEVRVVDEDGKPVAGGVTGEIVARGPRLMRGYWGQEAETARAVRGGWLYTGDLGYIDEDGYIYLQGRAKDFIKRGGEMVSPEEVENVIHAHPGVEECAVVGVPDETWGERVVAVVVPKAGASGLEEALLESCQQHLARFKRPEGIVLVDELPRNALGKVLKRELRERLTRRAE
ncbi:MAG: long-chain-fatty-acid--CoA ligase [SAR202 cluster bacterium]|nr:long-chain-fatty-acid--CoA ligase [SAR202 cluster bacterium]